MALEERPCRRPGEAEVTLWPRGQRGRSLLAAARLAASAVTPGAAAAAEPSDPDWPCIQRLVPQLAASQMWAAPSAGSGVNVSSAAGEATQLAHRLASRSMPVDEAEAAIDGFAAGLAPEERNAELARLFRDVLQLINQERSRIIAGIKRYTRKQR